MPDASTLLVFSAAALALIVVPGPAVLYIVATELAGAAYLVFLGVRRLLTRVTAQERIDRAPRSLGAVYRRGAIVNVLNPKTALFFFAFLPQFVDPDRGAT